MHPLKQEMSVTEEWGSNMKIANLGSIGRLLASVSAMAMCVMGSTAEAQTAAQPGQDDSVLGPSEAGAPTDKYYDEIIVTARQRQESLQDVPVTVEVFTASEIEAAGIQRPQDFLVLTPGVSQVQGIEVGDFQINIRGLNSGRDTESSVALVVDGVLLTNPNALNQELNGVTQIEVLKGPQGALYGRNALAGAIILTTSEPSEVFEATIKGGVGNHGLWEGSVGLSGPLSDRVGATMRAYIRDENGSFYNDFKQSCCENYFQEVGVNGRLMFDVGDNGEIDVKARYSEVTSGAVAYNASLALREAAEAGFGPAFFEDVNQHDFVYINNIDAINEQRNINGSVRGTFDLGFGTLTGTVSYNDAKNYFLSDGVSNAFGIYFANPECRANYDALNGNFDVPAPFFFAPDIANSFLPAYSPTICDGIQYQQRDQKDGAIELRIASPGDQRFRWMAGVYTALIERHLVVAYGGDLGSGDYDLGFVPTNGPNPTDLLFDDTFDSTVYAGFGNVAYDVTDKLEVAFAARYDIEKRKVDNNVPKVSPQTPGFGAFGSPVCPGGPVGCTYFVNPFFNLPANAGLSEIPSRSRTYKQLQPKISINWQPSEELSIFASYGYGFRSGGFNSSGTTATLQQFFGALALDDGTPNLNALADEFKKEVSKAAEVGFKARLMDGDLRFNGALFLTDSENQQDFSFFAGPFGSLRVVTNIDKAQSKGVEFDFEWRAADFLKLYGGIGYVETEIQEYSVRPYTVGNKLPYVPTYTGNVGAEFNIPLATDLKVVARVDELFVGKTWFSPIQQQTLPNFFTAFGFGQGDFSKQFRDPYQVTNANITLQADRWSLSAWVNNLFDKDFVAEIIPAPEFGGSFTGDSVGRIYGLRMSYKFGG
jgi:iron complex outermembrane receptor protein